MGRNREADTRVALGIGKADPEASEPRGGIERHRRNALLGLARAGLLGALGFPVRPFPEAVAHHPDAGAGDFAFSNATQNYSEPVVRQRIVTGTRVSVHVDTGCRRI